MAESTDTNGLPAGLEERLYEICFDFEPAARSEALDELCAAHPSHADSLCHRAAALSRSDELFGRVRGQLDEPADAERIGPFIVQSVLGQGGFGTVYLAEQIEPVQRLVALKVLLRGRVDTQSLQRFEDERQVLAHLQHACIAQVYDAGKTDEGVPYFAMEYVQGESVTVWCDNAQMHIEERLRLFLRICAAIHHAHQRGIVHRDIKPSNVLVREEDGRPLPKVIDFGVAKLLSSGDDGTARSGQVGTPGYMSPEQANGEPIDTRADVYALGVLLCELLTGQLPMAREDLQGVGFARLARLMEEPLRRPSRIVRSDATAAPAIARSRAVSQAALVRALSTDLDWIVLAALARQPDDRYASVAALADDVERYLRTEPLAVREPRASYVLRKFTARHRRGVAVAVTAGIVLIVGVLGLIWALGAVEQARLEAVAKGDEAGRQRDSATANAYAASMAAAQLAMTSGDVTTAVNYLAAASPGQRGWEWRHLAAQTNHALQTIVLENELVEVCWLDSDRFVGFGPRDEASIWSFAVGRPLFALENFGGGFDGFALDRSRGHIVVANRESIGIWSSRDGSHVRQLLPVSSRATSLAISADARILAIADRAGRVTLVRLERTAERSEPRQLASLPKGCSALAFAGSDALLVATLAGPILRVDLATEEIVTTYEGHSDAADHLLLDAASDRLFSASVDTTVRVWSLTTGRTLAALPGQVRVRRLALSPDASVVYAAGGWADNRISAWDTETFQLLGRYHGHRGGLTGLALDPSGATLLTTGRDLTLRVWSAVPPKPEIRLDAGRDARDLAVAADGSRFATAAGDGRITVWNADTLETELLLETKERWRGCAIGRHTLYAAGASVVAFALDDGEQQATGATESCYIERLLIAPDERWLIGGHGGRLLVWQLPELALRHALELPIDSARFAFDERRGAFVLACTDGALRWLDPDRGVVVKEQSLGNDCRIEGIALPSPSLHAGALLACVAGTEFLEVHESGTGRSVAAAVSGVAISPDGARVVTAGSDLKVRLWDPMTMSQLLVLGELIYSAPDVRFVAGGRRIVARSHRWDAPTYVYVWDAAPDARLPR